MIDTCMLVLERMAPQRKSLEIWILDMFDSTSPVFCSGSWSGSDLDNASIIVE